MVFCCCCCCFLLIWRTFKFQVVAPILFYALFNGISLKISESFTWRSLYVVWYVCFTFSFSSYIPSLLKFPAFTSQRTRSLLLNIFVVAVVVNFSLLAGVYGDVIRVKIMFNKKDTALIQFNDAIQAQTGQSRWTLFKWFAKPSHGTKSASKPKLKP